MLKPTVGFVMDWDSFATAQPFVNHFDQYTKIATMTVDYPNVGLFSGNGLSFLCNDDIVMEAAKKKIGKITYRVDTNNRVTHESERPNDPNVRIEFEGDNLICTTNMKDGLAQVAMVRLQR